MNNESTPLVSIIMPTYNSAKFVTKTIESIINQTYKNFELLITDDCSVDNTVHLIKELQRRDSRIKLFKLNTNSGAGLARNNSIENASGRFIAFCDSDDYWTQDKLEKQIPFMIKNKIALSYTNCYIVNEYNSEIKERNLPPYVNYKKMLKNNYIICSTAVYDTSKIGKRFMQDVKNRQDWLLWLDILKLTDEAFNINEKLVFYNKRRDSISNNKIKMMKYNWLVYYKYQGFSIFKSIYYIFLYGFIYLKKTI